MRGPLLTLTGPVELDRKMQSLDAALRGSIARQAVTAAAEPLEAAIRDATPIGKTRNLVTSIATAIRSYNGGKIIQAIVGPSLPLGRRAFIVIKGSAERFTRAGKSSGCMPANPFIERGFQRAKGAVESVLVESLAAGLAAEAER